MEIKTFSKEWGGRELKVEHGRYAHQAHGACTVQYGETVVLATAVMSENTREGIDFFPLMVDYEEKYYAAGKIKGSRFIKREGRPSEEAILAGRQIDRSIRPLFDSSMRNEVQVVITILAWDKENDPNVVGLIAASIALSISEIPWSGPLVGIRVGKVGDKLILNPTQPELKESEIDIFVAGTDELVTMVEAGAKESSEETVLQSIDLARKSAKPVLELIDEVVKAVGVEKRDAETLVELNDEQKKALEEKANVEKISQEFIHSVVDTYLFDSPKTSKSERKAAFKALSEKLTEHLKAQEIDEELISYVKSKIKQLVEAEVTKMILKSEKRVDGRSLTEVRPLVVETGLLPRVHGSGMFMRGETQVLSVTTLASPSAEQIIDTMELDEKKRYMHHYNFPGFSVGEAKPMRGPGRRDIGHGALAERALDPLIPDKEDFPYTIRVVSEVFGSNGSSSMASTCGSSLALMHAGVPIKKHVAGVAMGLASDDSGEWKVLTDIQDLEDGKGGMDFKITGTRDGITAMQMDTKTHGINADIVNKTFEQGLEARLHIIEQMEAGISTAKEMSKFAPRIVTIPIDPEKIRDVIGQGGKVINGIIDETGVEMDIEQDGRVIITSNDAEAMEKAVEIVQNIVKEVEAGEKYTGEVVRIEDFGAFINLLPGKDGLVHVSEIAWKHVKHPSDELKMGDKVDVLVKEIDNLGRVNLSIKALLPKPEGYEERPPRPRDDRRGGGGGGPRRNSGGDRNSGPRDKKRGFFRKKD